MASGEAEPLQYTTTVLRVSIHCEGCKKKVKKVLHNIEGVYKVTVDAAQHKVTVTGSVAADALVRRLHKAGKQAALWPAPALAPVVAAAPVVEAAKKPDEGAPAAPAEGGAKEGAGKAEGKPEEAVVKDKGSSDKLPDAEAKEKKPDKDKGSDKKAEAGKPKEEATKDAEVTAPTKEKGSPEPAKESAAAAAAEEAGGEEPSSGKKGKKKKNKQKDDGEAEPAAAAAEKTTPQPSTTPAAVPAALGPERPLGGFPYYAAQPVMMSYNVAHPSSSVSYYAPTPAVPMQPTPTPSPPPPPPHMTPYGYPQYPPMMMPPPPMPEYLYGPPGTRSSPPQESYNNMFNEENANSCSVM